MFKPTKSILRNSANSTNSAVRASDDSNAITFPATSHVSNPYTVQRKSSSDVSSRRTNQSTGVVELEGCSPSGRCKGHSCSNPSPHHHSDASSIPSRRGSSQVQTPSLIEDDDVFEGHRNVSRPPPPPTLHRLSQLIDPNELAMDDNVLSPEGYLLSPEQWLVHPDRPKCMRERQEEIAKRIRAHSLKTNSSIAISPDTEPDRKRSRSITDRLRTPSRLSRRSASSSPPSMPTAGTASMRGHKKSVNPALAITMPKRKTGPMRDGVVHESEPAPLQMREVLGNRTSCRALYVTRPSCWKSCWACFWAEYDD